MKKKKINTEIKIRNFKAGLYTKQKLIKVNSKDEIISLENIKIKKDFTKDIFSVENISLWDINEPTLYYLSIQLIDDGKIIDEKRIRFGFREVRFDSDSFYLNNKKIKIRGLNRHQSYPYVGYAMPASPQIRDADILKYELGLNAVRTSHYPQSHHFIDRCDEIGLLVFTEIPGWQYIGDKLWKEVAFKNIEDMIIQYRNHPSIIIWGVRINESADDDEFYKISNKIAHELDYSRPTGGVRCIKNSNLFEDVYTYNDFLHDGKTKGLDSKKKVTSNMNAPYLVSEYNGHMFPTKTFDCGAHVGEHALRHATVLNSLYKHDDIVGGFGWCMFDYNTHKDFGSGDRICYHGVMDMFRNEKLASSIYKCFKADEIELDVSSSMDVGEYPGTQMGDIYIFTNADSVRLHKNDIFIKEYKKEDSTFKYLKNGPILMDDLIGTQLEDNEGYSKKTSENIKKIIQASYKYGPNHLPLPILLLAAKIMVFDKIKVDDVVKLYNKYINNWGDKITTYRLEAIKDNKVVKVIEKKPMTKVVLEVDIDKNNLVENNTYDVSSIRIKVKDENKNLLRYYQETVLFKVEGDIELIGPKMVTLIGGMSGTYIKSIGKSGKGILTISSGRCEDIKLNFEIIKEV